MDTSSNHIIASLVLAMGFALCSRIARADDTRQISIEVHASRGNGDPVADLPFYVRCSTGLVAAGELGADGRKSVAAVVPATDAVVVVHMSTDIERYDNRRDNYLTAKLDILAMNACFHDEVAIILDPQVAEYTAAIHVSDCVTVSGQVHDAAGNAIDAIGLTAGRHSIPRPTSGQFAARAAKNRPTWLWIGTDRMCVLQFLTGTQLSSNINVGNLILPSRADDAQVTISATNYAAWDTIKAKRGFSGVSLIPLSGAMVITEEASMTSDGSQQLPVSLNIPHGSYYVIPSYFGPDIDQASLLAAIHQNVDLSTSDIPRLDIAEGEQKSMTLDLVAAQRALYKLLPYMTNP